MILYVFSVMLLLLNCYLLVYNYSTLYQKTTDSFLIKPEDFTMFVPFRLYVSVKNYLL